MSKSEQKRIEILDESLCERIKTMIQAYDLLRSTIGEKDE